ncbi:hypothetical protein H5410_059596 [Solanum commersonii]|uniref:Uncharacterized protein n=1 Tax=Solanum commersonii TaxID=4109 RepID=A0A9J5W3Y8_SOLCO|nr:hypothetical protein H5410_059596 [Solanum commersonii]
MSKRMFVQVSQRLVAEGAVSSLQITKAYTTGGVHSGGVNGEVITIACNVTVLSHLQYMHLMLVLGPFATMQAIAATLSFWPPCRSCFQAKNNNESADRQVKSFI